MSRRRGPRLDPRRESDFNAQLLARARRWIPDWNAPAGERDFAHALLAIAARFNAEVAERLDKGADKMALGLLDWLAIRGKAAVAARMPVVFKLTDGAAAVVAPPPVKLQADALGTPVVFETDAEVCLVPGKLEMVVGTDTGKDAYYLPPPGLSSLDPLEPLPTAWNIKSFAAAASATLQLDPALGLAPGMLVEIGASQFRIVEVKDDLATIDPPVPAGQGFDAGDGPVRKVTGFAPFDGAAQDRQFHALYLGHPDYLNIAATARIEVGGCAGFTGTVAWHYWGRRYGEPELGWQPFDPAPEATALRKPRGVLEPVKVGEVENRWIRASLSKDSPPLVPVLTEELTLRVNPPPDEDGLSGPCDADSEQIAHVGDVEAMANSTALELSDIFYPLGREPRQFDAFYLASAEAFSKRGASVRMCVDIADMSFESLAALRTPPFANRGLAGVARDGHLHLLVFDPATGRLAPLLAREPLRPPSPGIGGGPRAGLPVTLDPQPAYRPAIWMRDVAPFGWDMFVAVAARGAVWLWREFGASPYASGWQALGAVLPDATTQPDIAGLVFLAGAGEGTLFALIDARLHMRDATVADAPWTDVAVTYLGADVDLAKVAPIVSVTADLGAGTLADGLIAIAQNGDLYRVTLAGTPLAGTCVRLFTQADPTVGPVAVKRSDAAVVAVAVRIVAPAVRELRAWISTPAVADQEVPLDGDVVGRSIDVNLTSGQLVFALSVKASSGATGVAWWTPFNSSIPAALFLAQTPDEAGVAGGAPTLLAGHIVVPSTAGHLMVAGFDVTKRLTLDTHLKSAFVTPTSDTPFAVGDTVALWVKPTDALRLRTFPHAGVTRGGQTTYELSTPLGAAQSSVDPRILLFRSSGMALSAVVATLTEIELPGGDSATQAGTELLIATSLSVGLYRVIGVAGTAPRVATLAAPLDVPDPTAPPSNVSYWRPVPGDGRFAPLMDLDPTTTGNWDAALLATTALIFPGADPERQWGKAFKVDGGNHPLLVALASEWVAAPAAPASGTRFIVDGTIGGWSRQLGDTTSNPELSWEYWNGSAWWKISGLRDGTANLKRTGSIHFTLPHDLQPTDWSGTTSHWIRGRLVGGDYGQPRTIVKTTDKGSGVTEQTIERFVDEVRAPQLLRLRIQYAQDTPILPTHVLTEDNGAIRDQSDANRTPGAQVEVFTPLLAALSGPVDTPDTRARAAGCAPECGFEGAAASDTATSTASQAQADAARAIYLGVSGELAGQPVNLLVVVDSERPHGEFAPIKVEAMGTGRFVPVVASDGTRALGETGLISMSLTLPVVTAGLFGKPLCWLRLSPSRGDASRWAPSIRGVYINAAWASAAETMTREPLGSSIGAPGQTLQLARPPLLHGTLELRVREPLSAEERERLMRADPASVVSDVASDLPGHWVRWLQVNDPADCSPLERVYALDEASGIVRFGDGRHGAIPPTGRDAVVAFSYRRTEPGPISDVAPANTVAARTAMNLVTPIQGVEAAFAADQAAGGAPPEGAERVLRFAPATLRHRGRALTLRDFEDLALQSTPDVAQARALMDNGAIRLVVAMRGAQVQPNQAARRELKRMLADAAPASAAASLRVTGPTIRRLHVSLTLRVASLAGSGALAKHAKRSLARFFDPAQGGLEREGWPIGATPAEDDIALALLDAPGLEGIDQIAFSEIDDDGVAAPWQARMRADQLAVLAPDPVRIAFVIVETEP